MQIVRQVRHQAFFIFINANQMSQMRIIILTNAYSIDQ